MSKWPVGAVLILAGIVPCAWCRGPASPKAVVRTDRYGDPLPPGAVARLGTLRWRHPGARWLAYAPSTRPTTTCGSGT